MDLFERLDGYGFGEVHLKLDNATGLRAIVAIHDTRRAHIQPWHHAAITSALYRATISRIVMSKRFDSRAARNVKIV